MLDSKQLERLLEESISEDKEYIDVLLLCKKLRINVNLNKNLSDATQLGVFYAQENEDKYKRRFIDISSSLLEKESHTVITLLISKFCLSPGYLQERGYEVNVFDFKALRLTRFSRLMYLATRIALPEHIIEQIDDITLQNRDFGAYRMYTADLISCAVKGHTIPFLLENRLY